MQAHVSGWLGNSVSSPSALRRGMMVAVRTAVLTSTNSAMMSIMSTCRHPSALLAKPVQRACCT
jgi:hypothetical protein